MNTTLPTNIMIMPILCIHNEHAYKRSSVYSKPCTVTNWTLEKKKHIKQHICNCSLEISLARVATAVAGCRKVPWVGTNKAHDALIGVHINTWTPCTSNFSTLGFSTYLHRKKNGDCVQASMNLRWIWMCLTFKFYYSIYQGCTLIDFCKTLQYNVFWVAC